MHACPSLRLKQFFCLMVTYYPYFSAHYHPCEPVHAYLFGSLVEKGVFGPILRLGTKQYIICFASTEKPSYLCKLAGGMRWKRGWGGVCMTAILSQV